MEARTITIRTFQPDGAVELAWPAGESVVATDVPAAEAYAIRAAPTPTMPGDTAWLARRPRARVAVALVGRDAPMLRRYVEADDLLELAADPEEADVVIANGADAPIDRPALLIDPPNPPAGWRRGDARRNVTLDAADIAADDPLMAGVNVAGMAVRTVAPWIAGDVAAGEPAMLLDGEALVIRSTDAPGSGPRRVALAFDISAENTNLAVSEAFVILLANVTRWLADERAATGDYAAVRPMDAVDWRQWERIETDSWVERRSPDRAVLPWPGLYRDHDGKVKAVNLFVFFAQLGDVPSDADILLKPLPEPVRMQGDHAFGSLLTAVAAVLWVIGWWLRGGHAEEGFLWVRTTRCYGRRRRGMLYSANCADIGVEFPKADSASARFARMSAACSKRTPTTKSSR
jgi:hypothetical protein